VVVVVVVEKYKEGESVAMPLEVDKNAAIYYKSIAPLLVPAARGTDPQTFSFTPILTNLCEIYNFLAPYCHTAAHLGR